MSFSHFILCYSSISMETRVEPRIALLLDFQDANSLVSGVLNLKGCKVYKSKSAEDCLNLLNELEGQVDAVLVKKEIAADGNFMLIHNIKKIAPEATSIVLTDKVDEGENLSQHGVDELVLTPMSAENLADKILMMLARRDLRIRKEKEKNM
jgi:response regulator RpfG family c-di-GMP phosphodiesterase